MQDTRHRRKPGLTPKISTQSYRPVIPAKAGSMNRAFNDLKSLHDQPSGCLTPRLRKHDFEVRRSARQVLDRGHAAQTRRQALQQCQPVVAYGGVLDIDHDSVEEGIDLRTQPCQMR